MSNYDRIAIDLKPDLYFSSNAAGDQSGQTIYTLTKTATNVGQPIIVGNPSSWRVTSTEDIDIDINPIFFRENNTLEFVIQALQPADTICIFGDSNNFNGIFLTKESVEVRFIDVSLTQRRMQVQFQKWPRKMHIVLTFDDFYATLRVNDQVTQVNYDATDSSAVGAVSFKTTSGNTYYIDGIGIYSGEFRSKSDYIDAKPFGYIEFINKTHGGVGSLLDTYRGQAKISVPASSFTPDPLLEEYHLFTKTFTMSSDEDFDSISIESTYPTMPMYYSTNDVTWTSFTGRVTFTPSTNFFLLQIRVRTQDIVEPFVVNIFPMFDNKISTRTPAELDPVGGPFYPDEHSYMIVNYPEGVELPSIRYEGAWIEDIPKSIEILFMPKDSTKTIVFENADGSASCGTSGSITGFTAYLNGALVTDLNNARLNQWNHLVLTIAAPTNVGFFMNSTTAGTGSKLIEYAFLAGYPNQLTAGEVSQLYSILSSYHKLSHVEAVTAVDEGTLDGSSPFSVYTYAWAIVGGGGS